MLNRLVQHRTMVTDRCFGHVSVMLPLGFHGVPRRHHQRSVRYGFVSEPVPERDRLLTLAATHCIEHGVADLTLRRIADDLGTNNRMLLYYFDSKDGLIEAALLAAVDQFPRVVSAMEPMTDRDEPLDVRLGQCWRRISHPDNMPFIRLFFEVFGLAAHRPGRYGGYLTSVGTKWVGEVAAALRADGVDKGTAKLMAREIVALWRGLQFDLLTQVDRRELDRVHAAAAANFAHRPY